MSDQLSYTLKHPVEIKTKDAKSGEESLVTTITSVTFKTPKARHLIAMDAAKGEVGKSLHLVAAVVGLPFAYVEEFHAEDAVALMEKVNDFLPGTVTPSATGKTS